MPTQTTTSATPGRRTRHNNFKENINFFEPGKQGRRTGLVLKDTGLRDEHGLEPVSGIFSSPEPSPARVSPRRNNANGKGTALDSSDMVLQESSIPEITETLSLRKTPHLPPKTSTPRHTNIGGSPVRHSAIKPVDHQSSPVHAPLSAQSTNRTSRRLDFKNKAANVAPSPSPFKPRFGKSRKSIFDLSQQSPNTRQNQNEQDQDDIDNSVQQVQDAVDELFQQNPSPPSARSTRSTASQKRKRDPPSSPAVQKTPLPPRSTKRHRPSPENQQEQHVVDQTEADSTAVEQTGLEHTTVDQTGADYTTVDQTGVDYTTVDQTEAADQTEADYTEAPDQTEYTTVEQTEYTAVDQTEADYTTVDQTAADYTTVDQTVADYTTIDQTTADDTTADQTDIHHTVAEDTVVDTTELSDGYDKTAMDATMAVDPVEETSQVDESIVQKSAPHSTKKKRAFEVRREAEDAHQQEPVHVSSPGVAAQDFTPQIEDDQQDESEIEALPEPPKKKGRGKAAAKPRGGKKRQPTSRAESRPPPTRDSESVGPDGLKKPGPKSIVSLRAGTPAEDEGAKTTRSGRTSIKPLKYWCNETYVWNQGEVEGVVRATPVEQPKPKRAAPSRKKATRLGAIKEDEEEDEDLLPEAWEQELGVINSTVREWDPRIGTGSTETEGVNEDIAFASTAIKTQDVHGSSFRYAKVMTLPFFGSGMVEIPPNGFKRMKNSRKMQMVFFVHEGKVTVEIEDVQFGMTKGGVWQVPRGNNYAIMNESDRHPAKIFFAQGCEMATSLGDE